jgi:two-component system, NtrC family, response regulator HydG
MNKDGRILVVDDNAGIRSALKILLPMHFEAVELLPSPVTLVTTVERFKPEAVLLDMNFTADINSGNEGLYWLGELKSRWPELKVVLFTAYADVQLAVEGMKRGAYDFIPKPWDNERLISTLHSACQASRKARKTESGGTGGVSIYWGESPEMNAIRRTISKIAPTDATILITGENGTGKDVLAGEIHRASLRAGKKMVSVDAGAIPDTLFESELFGHVKGAFTDAVSDHPGKFEQASGGTLFLDEIGNIPLASQAKLLRVLQNRSVTRVGDTRSIPVDIRLICATNMDLAGLVADGSFREDLYYRINTMHLHIPPLRERPEDILHLAGIFIDKFAAQYHREASGLSPEAQKALREYPWPGNIRELQNCIEKAVILSEGSELKPEDLQLPDSPVVKTQDNIETLEEAEERTIRSAMDKFAGNLSLVAKALNISRPTLYSKLKKYGI